MGHLHHCDLHGRSLAVIALVGFWDHEGIVGAGQALLDNFPRGCQDKAGWPVGYVAVYSAMLGEKKVALETLQTALAMAPGNAEMLPAHNLQCWKAIPQRRPGTSPCV